MCVCVLTLRMTCSPSVFAGHDLSPAEKGKKLREPSACPKPLYASSLFLVLSNLAILSGWETLFASSWRDRKGHLGTPLGTVASERVGWALVTAVSPS